MNKVKKTINHPPVAKTGIKSIYWIITSIVLVFILIGGVVFDQLYKTPLLTINGDKYSLDALRYYFYTVESQYDYYNQIFGGSYWDMQPDEKSTNTMRDVAKKDAIDTSLYTEVLYKEAKSKGYTLTADEKKTVATNVKKLLSGQLTEAVVKKNGFTSAYLTKVLSKATLIDRYRADVIAAQKIDKDKITAGVKKDDYRQYNFEYLFISTKKTDDSGNNVDLTADEKTAAYNKINAFYDKALTAKDWSTLVPKDETDVTYKEDNFVENDSKFTKEFKDQVKTLANGDVSKLIEDTSGYYIVHMKDNNSSEAYDSAVKQAISDAESTAFQKVYQDTLKNNYKYSINNKALSKITMGNLTL